jgi:hypothetical protein
LLDLEKIIWSICVSKGEIDEFLLNRQILFLFQVLFLYRPACCALKSIFNKKAAGSQSLRLFCFKLPALG